MHLYFAAPLFSESESLFNAHLAQTIRERYPQHTIYLPQENGDINDKQAYADSKMIALADTEEVKKSQLMIALLDGLTIDPGVASEIGIAYASNIPIIGLYTDSRQQGATNTKKINALKTIGENQFHYVNLYTIGLIKLNGEIFHSTTELLVGLKNYLEERDH
ncbi:nucleoside 2-deoxyribosyltransferase [Enterococcus camelliae]|uniref:Nucleoside 2-deoxyribosyltransferase n=1 Tax=Enterococcus camelliae TaxID=453959 RepID=A0ABW5TH61_9ENTE